PNRVFNIEWRACIRVSASACTAIDTNFEARLYEGQDKFDLVYGSMAENGGGATVGVQRATGVSFTQYSCNTASLSTGLQVTFRPLACGEPTLTATITPTPSATPCGANSVTGSITGTDPTQPGRVVRAFVTPSCATTPGTQ